LSQIKGHASLHPKATLRQINSRQRGRR